jgi:hypothetical protein
MIGAAPPPCNGDVVRMSYWHQESASGNLAPRVMFPAAFRHQSSAETLNTADALFARIDSLTQLPSNWDTYGAAAPSAVTALWAKSATGLADGIGLTPIAIVPSPENGIGIAFRRGQRYGDIEIFNSGEILAVISDGSGKPNVWEVEPTISGMADALRTIRDYLW